MLTALDFSEHQMWKLHEDTLYTVIILSTIVAKNHGDHLLPSFSPVLRANYPMNRAGSISFPRSEECGLKV